MAERPKDAASEVARRDDVAMPASHEPPGLAPTPCTELRPNPILNSVAPPTKDVEAEDANQKAGDAGKTFSFQMRAGIGPEPVEIELVHNQSGPIG